MARGLTYVSRKKELTNQLALQVRFISTMQKSMRRQIRLSMQEATTKFEKSGSNAGIDAVIDKRKPELYVILVAQYRAIMKTFGKRILDVAKFAGPVEIKANDDLFEQSIQQYINLWATDKVTLISDTTKEQMSRLIANGLGDGLWGLKSPNASAPKSQRSRLFVLKPLPEPRSMPPLVMPTSLPQKLLISRWIKSGLRLSMVGSVKRIAKLMDKQCQWMGISPWMVNH